MKMIKIKIIYMKKKIPKKQIEKKEKKKIIDNMKDILKKLDYKKKKINYIKQLEDEINVLKNYKLSRNNFESMIMVNINKLKENIDQEEFNKRKKEIIGLLAKENI